MSNGIEYAERHLEAFYEQYASESLRTTEKPREGKIEGGEQREHSQNSGRNRGVC